MPDAEDFLSRMLVATINAREVQSERVSRTLHDDVGQVLSAVGLQLDVLKLDYKERLPEIVERTDEIQRMLDQAVQQVRTLSYDLNPSIVERTGLLLALDRLVGRSRQKFGGAIRFQYDSAVRVPVHIGNAWYKIADHAMENALRHSSATRIELQVRPSGAARVLEIRDTGIGFDRKALPAHVTGLGLLLMEHYAAQAGIGLDIASTPGKGTVVRSVYRPARNGEQRSRGD